VKRDMKGHCSVEDPKEVMCAFPYLVPKFLLEDCHWDNDETCAKDHNQTRDTGFVGDEKTAVSLVYPSKAMAE